jgi:hypothetical protein
MNIWGWLRSNQMTHIFIGFRTQPTNIKLYLSVSKPMNLKSPMNVFPLSVVLARGGCEDRIYWVAR